MVTSSLSGRQCKYDAEPETVDAGRPRCVQHLYTNERRGAEGHHMSRYYLKTLRPALAVAMEQAMEAMETPLAHLDLSEEVALMRLAAKDGVEAYAQALEDAAKQPTNSPKAMELKLSAGVIMAEKLKDVQRMVEGAAGIEKVKAEVMDLFSQVMAAVITSVSHAAWEIWGDDIKVKEFTELLKQKLERRQVTGITGTEVTPDMDVQEMDDTVPREPEVI
jgi:hypothetical protein